LDPIGDPDEGWKPEAGATLGALFIFKNPQAVLGWFLRNPTAAINGIGGAAYSAVTGDPTSPIPEPCPVKSAIKDAELKTVQSKISGPVVNRYVNKLKQGLIPPPIKVADGVIIEGNHRYAAGKVFGREPARVPGVLSPSQAGNVRPFGDIHIDPTDWGNH
jgi:hypothetical protein